MSSLTATRSPRTGWSRCSPPCRRSLGEIQGALDQASAAGPVTLARSLRRVSDALRRGSQGRDPEGELKLLGELWPVEAPSDWAVQSLRDQILLVLEFPWLLSFSLARTDPIEQRILATFVARLAGSGLGQLLGEAMREDPDSEPALVLRDKGIRS